MASLNVNGIDDVTMTFQQMVEGGEEMITEMLDAETEIIEEQQKKTGRSMGVYDESSSIHVVNRIGHTKVKKVGDEYKRFVYPKGSRTRHGISTTNAEIAFINEYGKTGQPARPWITTANAQAEDRAVDAAENVFDNWIKKFD